MRAFQHMMVLLRPKLRGVIDSNGAAMTGALIVCLAVILNIGPFTLISSSRTSREAPITVVAEPTSMHARPAAAISEPPSFAVAAAPEPEQVLQTAFLQRADVTAAELEPPAAPVETLVSQADQADEAGPAEAHEAVPAAVEQEAPPPAETHEAAAPIPLPPPAPADRSGKAAVAGVWAPDTATCSARELQKGLLPAVITADGAWAGETFCIFTRKRETDAGLRTIAKCSTAKARWTSNVRLTVHDNKLTWASEKGTQTYTRCEDVVMARAN